MTSSTTKARFLQAVGLIALLVALANDAYLHLSLPLLAVVVVVGSACLVIRYRMGRGARVSTELTPLSKKHRQFAILFGIALLVCIGAAIFPDTHMAHLSLSMRII